MNPAAFCLGEPEENAFQIGFLEMNALNGDTGFPDIIRNIKDIAICRRDEHRNGLL